MSDAAISHRTFQQALKYKEQVCLKKDLSAQAIPGLVFSADTKTWKVAGGCEAVDALDDITFVMGGNKFSLGPRQYIIQVCIEDTKGKNGYAYGIL